MATTRPFSYNPLQSAITGTINIGTLCIGVSPLAYSANPGGLTWWMGPDEDNSYVIAKDVSTTNFPTPVGNVGNVQFWRSTNTDEAFTNLVSLISGTAQASASAASDWLLTNGYWTNYDAQAFINAASITDTTQKTAIDTLVNGLKADNLWAKMIAVYPFVGGTDTSHKYNLKDPRDDNTAFRLTFSGGWTHSSTGIQGNGINTYANTYFIPSSNWSSGNSSISAYSRTIDTTFDDGSLWGALSSGGASLYPIHRTSGSSVVRHNSSTGNVLTVTTTAINLMSSRVNTSQYIIAQNGTTITRNIAESGLPIVNVYLGARNNSSIGAMNFSYRELAFAHIGTGLTTGECTTLYNRIQEFQTILNRQV